MSFYKDRDFYTPSLFRKEAFKTGLFYSIRSRTLVLDPTRIGSNYVTEYNVYTSSDLMLIGRNWEEVIINSKLLERSGNNLFELEADLCDYDCCADGHICVQIRGQNFDCNKSNRSLILLWVPFNSQWHTDFDNILNWIRKCLLSSDSF